MARAPSRRKRSPAPRARLRRALPWLGFAAVLGLCALVVYAAYLNRVITEQFERERRALPAQVYARPLELFPGARLPAGALQDELRRLGYRRAERARRPGSFHRDGARLELVTRRFAFWDGVAPSRRLAVRFDDGRIAALRERPSGEAVPIARLDPAKIGSIYPQHGEDRVLVSLDQVPELLIRGLMVVEDRRFRSHHGVDPIGIGRALVANLRAGEIVQGGSTLTQQLARSYFLGNRQSLWRKLTEAIMAVLLDARYGKDEILEAYVNEIYLGQAGDRAIHGFGLASRFYFDRSLDQLAPHQIALLVTLVRGPSYYDPQRHPERARARRDRILDAFQQHDVLSPAAAARARAEPLGIAEEGGQRLDYPGFMQLVRERLLADYRAADLTRGGLRIFTTLDPAVQAAAETALGEQLARLERRDDAALAELQGATVVTDVDSAEVLALVADRDPRYAGFNRALDARRPVGSLIKPAVYLTALEQPERYHLATLIEDSPLDHRLANGDVWQPENYSGEYHGEVPLYRALAHSYNAATARLGLSLGVRRVVDTLHRLGMAAEPQPYPSLLLGAVEMSPLEVARIYQTVAAGGFRSRLRAIREVVTRDGEPLQRYPIELREAVERMPNHLLVRALQQVARTGTARGVYHGLPASLGIAGKTGTSGEHRDSWFAGFTGDRLAVVWVGRDDNRPTGLTGATGALPVWRRLMQDIEPRPLAPAQPDGVEMRWIDPASGRLADESCPDAVQLPFAVGSGPEQTAPCAGREQPRDREGPFEWLKRWFR